MDGCRPFRKSRVEEEGDVMKKEKKAHTEAKGAPGRRNGIIPYTQAPALFFSARTHCEPVSLDEAHDQAK